MGDRNKVKISSLAAVTPMGNDEDELVLNIRSRSLPAFYPRALPGHLKEKVRVSAFDESCFHRVGDSFEGLISRVLDRLVADRGLSEGELARTGLLVGTSGCIVEAERAFIREKERGEGHPVPISIEGAGSMSLSLARMRGIKGPVITFTTACTSSANALLSALSLIEEGDLERVIVIGAEVLNSLTMNGFFSLMLLTSHGCRPFDREREGIHLGEGVAALLLEATGNDDKGIVLAGGANLCDRENVISISKDGSSIRAVMNEALDSAGIGPEQVRAIKTHGIGSKDNDAAEALAMKKIFGKNIPPFTSLKGYFGHTLGAAGAIELVALLACLKRGFIPAAAGFCSADELMGISPLEQEIQAGAGYYLLNFLGFGGNNTSMVLRYE
ncbi:MAG: hypothetical protein OEV42_20190 [Deltaproteobacteria bacterium]|nr:hypothetical protein [Deltaproteobacteria bacterium]